MTTNQTTANGLLNLILTTATFNNIAENASSSPNTQLWAALHTADPTATGNQSSSEIAYTSYARVAVARTTGGFTTSTVGSSSPQANITFPTGTGGSGTATFCSLGLSSSGAGIILWSGPISPSIVCGNGVTPALTTSSTIVIS